MDGAWRLSRGTQERGGSALGHKPQHRSIKTQRTCPENVSPPGSLPSPHPITSSLSTSVAPFSRDHYLKLETDLFVVSLQH